MINFKLLVFLFRFFVLVMLNFLVFALSPYIDTDQLSKDLTHIFGNQNYSNSFLFWWSSFAVSSLSLIFIRIFKPFIEIYLLHYSKFFFYILINLISLSSVYLVLRIYGYSRLLVLFYVFLSSLIFLISDKFVRWKLFLKINH